MDTDRCRKRQAITAATHIIDQQLRSDPYNLSESRGGEDRIHFAYPLGIQIEIDAERGIVWVLNVWQFKRRGE